jgi:dTDP-4-dehydrorhamnose reductase
MKKKILVVGKNSVLGSSFSKFFKNKFLVKMINFEEIKSKSSKNFFLKYDYIINCTSNLNYIKKKYNFNHDHDLFIANKIKDCNCKFVFISTRKVYKVGDNLKETSKLLPNCNYSKNKLITEKNILSLLRDKVLILRVSNIIGFKNKRPKYRKLHKTFIDYFLENINKNIIFDNADSYKDFLTIGTFTKIVLKLIEKNVVGIYNVSYGKKIYLSRVINWLNYHNPNKVKILKASNKFQKENFYLNNKKLKNCIDLKIHINDLEKYCKKISKNIFIKK